MPRGWLPSRTLTPRLRYAVLPEVCSPLVAISQLLRRGARQRSVPQRAVVNRKTVSEWYLPPGFSATEGK
jgi:hypothetical protein